MHTSQCVSIENLLEAIDWCGFGVVQLPRYLDMTTLKVQMNQSGGVLAAVIKTKQYPQFTFGVLALPMLAHLHPGEFERSSVLHGHRPSCIRVGKLVARERKG